MVDGLCWKHPCILFYRYCDPHTKNDMEIYWTTKPQDEFLAYVVYQVWTTVYSNNLWWPLCNDQLPSKPCIALDDRWKYNSAKRLIIFNDKL